MTSTALANLEKQLAEESKELSNKLKISTDKTKISTNGKIFTLPDGSSSNGPLNVIVLDWLNYNVYYKNPYDKNNIVPPDCYALSDDADTMGPADDADDPQSEKCNGCAMNKFGTAQNGKGKACQNRFRLAVVEPGVTDPENDPIYTIEVNPKASGLFAKYAKAVANEFSHPLRIITMVGFDENQTYPSLIFQRGVPHDNLATVMAMRNRAAELIARSPMGND